MKLSDDSIVFEFDAVAQAVRDFLSPITQALRAGALMPNQWTAPGPWTSLNAEWLLRRNNSGSRNLSGKPTRCTAWSLFCPKCGVNMLMSQPNLARTAQSTLQ